MIITMFHKYVIIVCVAGVAMTTPAAIFNDDGSAEVTCSDGQGHAYTVGEWMPKQDDCHAPCWCDTEGTRQCRNQTCEFTGCVNIQPPKPGECCPTCPNGANCRLGDGFLEEGKTQTETYGRTCSKVCQCLYGGQDAICILQCDDVPPLDLFGNHVDQNGSPPPPEDTRAAKSDRRARKKQRRRRKKVFRRWRWT